MRAMSLYQPWAEWVALGLKEIETRTHDRFRGLVGERIAIHAGKRFDKLAMEAALPWMVYRSEWKLELLAAAKISQRAENRGAIICTARVYRAGWLSQQRVSSVASLIDCERVQRFGLYLDEVRRLPRPVPFRGRQGIFTVSDELIESAFQTKERADERG
jgi:hypothetical protein